MTHDTNPDVWEQAQALLAQQQRESAGQRLQAAEQRAAYWEKEAEQRLRWQRQAMAWSAQAFLWVAMLGFAGFLASGVYHSFMTDRYPDAEVVSALYSHAGTVLDIPNRSGGRDARSWYCPRELPIVATFDEKTLDGIYYLPGDERDSRGPLWCFRSEEAAQGWGYTRAGAPSE